MMELANFRASETV